MNHTLDRDEVIINELQQELVGPFRGSRLDRLSMIDFTNPIDFPDWSALEQPYIDRTTREEILIRERPTKRYGVSVLYPAGIFTRPDGEASNDPDIDLPEEIVENEQNQTLVAENPTIESVIDNEEEQPDVSNESADQDDSGVASAYQYKPGAMGISFLVKLPVGSKIKVLTNGARYEGPVDVTVDGRSYHKFKGWRRIPLTYESRIESTVLLSGNRIQPVTLSEVTGNNFHLPLRLELTILSRPRPEPFNQPDERLVTIVLVNRSNRELPCDDRCFFQCGFTVLAENGAFVIPYPESYRSGGDEDDASNDLLYRDFRTYATGHGCAANWDNPTVNRVQSVKTDSLPVFETPAVSFDLDGIELPIRLLAFPDKFVEGMERLSNMVNHYRSWIESSQREIASLPVSLRETATSHITQCDTACSRMEQGIKFLMENDDPRAVIAFQLTNRAMLFQQYRGHLIEQRTEPRPPQLPQRPGTAIEFPNHPPSPEEMMQAFETVNNAFGNNLDNFTGGKWRPFQIAFLLYSLKSAIDGNDPFRDCADLIWFPTGGGKTEAYLGLLAFVIFYRRLSNSSDDGTAAMMRYTLRLLTAQQFQRASRLVCAMEYLRRKSTQLNNEYANFEWNRRRGFDFQFGYKPFSLGIWAGGSVSPNNHKEALYKINLFRNQGREPLDWKNPYLVIQCPWCGAQMGPPTDKVQLENWTNRVLLGYETENSKFFFKCPDQECDFHRSAPDSRHVFLPVFVVDEEVYSEQPSLVIGTVDKYAVLAWSPKARTIFGLDSQGAFAKQPPSLIIQDELHLISGPIGSLYGLYETVIGELCTDTFKPKVICSTATARRYRSQIKNLYARDAALFPPPGLSASDSFFAWYNPNLPGRKFMGVFAPGLGSMQTVQVRTINALLQAPYQMSEASQELINQRRDPWWTVLCFFNSLRELGNTISLLESDIPVYGHSFAARTGRKRPNRHRVLYSSQWCQLTSNTSDGLSKHISQLKMTTSTGRALGVCLATTVIEAGVDVDRLALLVVTGQPKSMSQYIQVTGRVGRKKDKPGLVVTLYAATRPRDRSHFEQFRSGHERLYAQVEPVSVTPFSPESLRRALHASIATYCQQRLPLSGDGRGINEAPFPLPQLLINFLNDNRQRNRVDLSLLDEDRDESLADFDRWLNLRLNQWNSWQPETWDYWHRNGQKPLLYPAGTRVSAEMEDNLENSAFETLLSMRDVDVDCRSKITDWRW